MNKRQKEVVEYINRMISIDISNRATPVKSKFLTVDLTGLDSNARRQIESLGLSGGRYKATPMGYWRFSIVIIGA